MERIVKKNSKVNKRRVARKAPAQRPSFGFSQASHVPVRFPLFPRQLQFSSTWTQTREIDLASTSFSLGIGLFDYLNHIPEYVLECYQLYRYSRICGVDVTLSVAGESDEANQNFSYEVAMAKVPFDQIGLPPQALRLVRGSRYNLVATSGMNRLTQKGSFGSFDELGNPVYSRDYWQTLTDATMPTPADTNRPVVALAVSSVNGNRGLVALNVSVTYHLQFFELEWSRIPELQKSPVEQADTPVETSGQSKRKETKKLRVDVEEFTPLEISRESRARKAK